MLPLTPLTPDGARAGVAREANPTIAGDDGTHGSAVDHDTTQPSASSATDADAGAASPAAATRKRKGRRKYGTHAAQDERKRQRYLLNLRDNTEAGT